MENDLDQIRSKLKGLAGSQLEDEDIATLLAQVLGDGGGVVIELDSMSFKLLRRDGKFTLVRAPRKALSTMPPRR